MKDQSVIYMYPKETTGNLYLSSCRSIFELGGAQVKILPTSLLKLLPMLVSRKDYIVINWFEDRIYKSPNQLFLLLKRLVLLIFIRLIFNKVIWVRHNFRPHNSHSKLIHDLLLYCLDKFTDYQVTHRPVKKINSHYVPHPLYPDKANGPKVKRDIPFLYFGVIKRYKGLVELLTFWPKSAPLLMVGRCADDALISELTEIIKKRSLSVRWEKSFLDYSELSSLICRSMNVIIPHADQSMIVSGAFYHAVGLGANVVIRNGEFFQDYLKRFEFVTPFDNTNLAAVISSQQYIDADKVLKTVKSEFSNECILDAWEKVFNAN